jgi:hypothetical protein
MKSKAEGGRMKDEAKPQANAGINTSSLILHPSSLLFPLHP